MHRLLERVAATAAIVVSCFLLGATAAQAATITVNDLADDVFPDSVGAIFDINGSPVALGSPKCTLRMAISSANLDIAVGGVSNGCASGSGTDTIVFSAALNLATTPGAITLASKLMDGAPVVFSPPNATSTLLASTPMTITGPGSAQLTIDGSVAGADGRRIFGVSNGDQDVDFQFSISGLRFLRGRIVDSSSGCMFSRESVSITDVIFEDCESVGGATSVGFGGALGVGNQTAGSAVPTVTVTNSRFLGNRSVRGTNPGRPEVGGAFFGSGATKVGTVTLTNATFNGNSAEYKGAMNIQNAVSVTISGSHFIGNAATGTSTATVTNGRFGGFQIVTVSGDVTINNATRINGNVANEERAGFSIQQVGGTVTLNEVDVSGNYVNRGRIGGFEILTDNVFNADSSCAGAQLRPVNLSNVRIQGNSVASNTGGFRILCSGAVTMTDVWVVGNETRGYRLAQSDTVSTGNSAFQIFADPYPNQAQSTATLTRVTVENNSTDATAGGGGNGVARIDRLGAFTADSLRFINNFVTQNVGLALSAQGAGRNYLITNSEFSGNSAAQIPTLFVETDGNYALRNSTVSGNVARNGGGSTVRANANSNTPGGFTFAIEHSTIARNTGGFEEAFGVVVFANPVLFGGANAVISVKNSILGPRSPGFTGATTVAFNASVTNITTDHSLLEWNGGAPASFCTGAGMKCNVGSLVSPLAYNGGSDSIRTMALMAGSPAINAGGGVLGGLTTDQRGSGFPRVIGGTVDMGAYESDPATTVGCTLDLDGNGGAPDALTDGLLSIRAMFGLTGAAATTGAIGAAPTRPDWTAIRNYLNANCGTSFAP